MLASRTLACLQQLQKMMAGNQLLAEASQQPLEDNANFAAVAAETEFTRHDGTFLPHQSWLPYVSILPLTRHITNRQHRIIDRNRRQERQAPAARSGQ